MTEDEFEIISLPFVQFILFPGKMFPWHISCFLTYCTLAQAATAAHSGLPDFFPFDLQL